MKPIHLLPAFLVVLLIGLLYFGMGLNPREIPSPFIGKPAPAFDLERLNQEGRIQQDYLQGNVHLVNFWASWCPSCREEHDLIARLSQEHNLPILGINYKDERAAAQQWLARLGNPYIANAWDYEGRTGIDWGAYGTPESFLIDQQGIIQYKVTGPVTNKIIYEELLPRILQLRNGVAGE